MRRTLTGITLISVAAIGVAWRPAPGPAVVTAQSAPRTFTVDQILGFPSPDNLVASPAGSTVAWTYNERGVRNVFAAEAPGFEARKVTAYTQDDGQELTQLAF